MPADLAAACSAVFACMDHTVASPAAVRLVPLAERDIERRQELHEAGLQVGAPSG